MRKKDYEPWVTYLQANSIGRETFTFQEIENVLGRSLPYSKTYQAWWSNHPSNNPMTALWLAAGYKTEAVDPVAQRVTFFRCGDFAGA